MTRGCCWFLLTWQLGPERENSKSSVSRGPGGSCKAAYDLALEGSRMSLLSYSISQASP